MGMIEQLKTYENKHEYGIPMAVCGDYKYIWAWGKSSGSMDYYIARQVLKAIEDKAPADAVYYDEGKNEWQVLKNCHESTQKRIKIKTGEESADF